LIVEWVKQDDQTAVRHDYNQLLVSEEVFKNALSQHFPVLERLGNSATDRVLILGKKNNRHSTVWVRRDTGRVEKTDTAFQTFGCTRREWRWLNVLAGLNFQENQRFPRPLEMRDDTIVMGYTGLSLGPHNLPENWEDQGQQILDCLKKADCAHNDIRPANLTVLDGKLHLIDFGWATEIDEKIPKEWPKQLGGRWARGMHDLNDEYSLRRSLKEIDLARKR